MYSRTAETRGKSNADEMADKIRGQGYKARVVKREKGYGVYRGPKRKTRSQHERRSARTAFRRRR